MTLKCFCGDFWLTGWFIANVKSMFVFNIQIFAWDTLEISHENIFLHTTLSPQNGSSFLKILQRPITTWKRIVLLRFNQILIVVFVQFTKLAHHASVQKANRNKIIYWQFFLCITPETDNVLKITHMYSIIIAKLKYNKRLINAKLKRKERLTQIRRNKWTPLWNILKHFLNIRWRFLSIYFAYLSFFVIVDHCWS